MLDIIKFLDCIGIDILGLLFIIRNGFGNEYIMVICDYFLKWIEVYVIFDYIVIIVVDKFMIEFILKLGCLK